MISGCGCVVSCLLYALLLCGFGYTGSGGWVGCWLFLVFLVWGLFVLVCLLVVWFMLFAWVSLGWFVCFIV